MNNDEEQKFRSKDQFPSLNLLEDHAGDSAPSTAHSSVNLKEVLGSDQFRAVKSKLALSIGKDDAGSPQIIDLADMPHLFIGGADDSEKIHRVVEFIKNQSVN